MLGIDPGLSETGWAVVDGGALVASGCVKTPAGMPLGLRLRKIHETVLDVIDTHAPETVAIEQLFFMKSTASQAATSQARGVVLLASELRATPVHEYNPKDVKVSITGNGAAPKPQMQKMVQMILKLPAPLTPDDVADAAAIALCHVRATRFKSRIVK